MKKNGGWILTLLGIIFLYSPVIWAVYVPDILLNNYTLLL